MGAWPTNAAARVIGVIALAALSACGDQSSRPDVPPAAREPPRDGAAETPAPAEQASGERKPPSRRRVLVALEDQNAVAVLAGDPLRVVARRRVARGPHNAAAAPAGRRFAVSSPPAGAVTILGAGGRIRAVARIAGGPHDVRFTPDGRRLWVTAERAGRLVELTASGRVLRSVDVGGSPHDLAISPDGRRLWVTVNGSAAVQVRSAATGRLLERVLPGGSPHDLAFRPPGGEVWFSSWSSGRLYVAGASGRARGSVRAGAEPHHFAFGLGRLWTSDNGGGAVVRLDPARRRVIGRTRVGRAPHHVAVSGGQVLVAVNGTGRLAIVSRRGRLQRTVRVGAGPHGIAALP